MYCVMCGTQNPDHARFCLNCGGEIVKSDVSDNLPKQNSADCIEELPIIPEELLPPSDNENGTETDKCQEFGDINGSSCDRGGLSCLTPPDVNNEQPAVNICPKCGNAFSGESEVCPYCHITPAANDETSAWICPECYEENTNTNLVCKGCGYVLTSKDNMPINTMRNDNKSSWICKHCNAENLQYDNVCSHCGAKKGDKKVRVTNHQHKGAGCYRHPDRTPVAQCPKCGAFMCQQCYNRYEGHLCKNCTYENNQAYISRIRTSLIFAAIFFVLGWIIGGSVVGSGGFLVGLWAAGLPGGFAFNWFDAYATWEMGCLGTVFYWIFRLLVASVAGLILTIINIFRLIHAISVQHDLEEYDIWD